jgi:hypothetical protein
MQISKELSGLSYRRPRLPELVPRRPSEIRKSEENKKRQRKRNKRAAGGVGVVLHRPRRLKLLNSNKGSTPPRDSPLNDSTDGVT